MIVLNCDSLTLSFAGETVLEDITFFINEGDRLGIVGVNGAGKTTLFKLITGEYSPDSGAVFIAKDHSLGILDQYLDFDDNSTLFEEMLRSYPELTAMEERLNSLHAALDAGDISRAEAYASLHDRFTREGGYEYKGRCRGTLKSLGFDESFFDLKISALSGGQKTRLALARLLTVEPDILMLDEPTNHLDMDALFWLESFLKNYRKTVIVISHDRYFLDSTVTKVLEIENKSARMYNGNYTRFVEQKASDREIQERHWRNQQKEIARIEAYIEQQRRWGRERNIIAAESRQKQLDKLERVERPDALPKSIRLRFRKSLESGDDVLHIRRLTKGYPGKPLFKNVNLLVKKREHVFILGHNGCGKSTLIKLIAGKLEPDGGSVEYGYNVDIGYYDQENQELCDSNTVLDELWNDYPHLTETEIRNALALFLFRGDDIEKTVSVLSGGERARLTLCKLILSKMNLLILDEPTNHLDINSREVLEKALLDFGGTIIAVSHDRYFISKLATRILDFNSGASPDRVPPGQLFDFRGTYPEYLEYKEKYLVPDSADSSSKGAVTESREQYEAQKKAQSDRRRHEGRLRRNADEIAKLEAKLDGISAEMHGEAASDAERVAELYDSQLAAEERLLELYELQEELEQQGDEFD